MSRRALRADRLSARATAETPGQEALRHAAPAGRCLAATSRHQVLTPRPVRLVSGENQTWAGAQPTARDLRRWST